MTAPPGHPPARSAAPRVDLFPTLRGYRAAWLRRDVVGGLSAGAVVVPQAMAYATIANLPVSFGLYTCMVPLVVYALLGGSRTLSMSTTSTIATLSASTLLAAGVAAGSDDPARAVSTLTLLVGALLLLTRLLRLGSLVENISQATLVGIKAGVGATVAAAQLPHLLGVPVDPDATGFFRALGSALGRLEQAVPATVALSLGSILVLLVLGRVAPRVPAPLVVVAAGILLVAFAGLTDHGVEGIEPIPPGLPSAPCSRGQARSRSWRSSRPWRWAEASDDPTSRRSPPTRSSSPTGSRPWSVRSSVPCPRPVASPRPRSACGPGPGARPRGS